MKNQLFYTEEGKTYVVRTISTKKVDFNNVTAINQVPTLIINPPLGFPTSIFPTLLEYSTPKKIIPIQFNYSVLRGGFSIPDIDISSCYYGFYRLFGPNQDHINAFNKMIPLIQRVFYTTDNYYAYNCRYTNCLLAEKDFIDPNGTSEFRFFPEIANAISSNTNPTIILPLGNINITSTFTFLELQ